MTRQRKLITEIIRSEEEHMTAEQIYKRAAETIPAISLATVYRNLSLMTACGDIARIPMDGKPDRYDRTMKPHDHMICAICGGIRDVLIPGLADAIAYQTGEKVLAYTLTIRYICPACREKTKEGA